VRPSTSDVGLEQIAPRVARQRLHVAARDLLSNHTFPKPTALLSDPDPTAEPSVWETERGNDSGVGSPASVVAVPENGPLADKPPVPPTSRDVGRNTEVESSSR
jgi:hypothetical protein